MALNSTTLDPPPSSLSPPSKFQLPSLPPLTISLTAGTNIPPPPLSPSPPPPLLAAAPEPQRHSPAERTANPLSSHPTTPSDLMPGAFPPTPFELQDRDRPPTFPRIQPTPTTTSTSSGITTIASHSPSGSPQTPASPISPSSATSTSTKRPSSVRRFLSLRSLNISYLINKDKDSKTNNNNNNNNNNASSNSPSSPLSSPSPLSQLYQHQQHQARPASPLSTGISSSPRPGLRKKKSASWFRRRSSMGFDELISASGDGGMDGSGAEEVENRRPVTRGSGEEGMAGVEVALERPRSPPPRLPELGGLGVSLDVGGLGEGMFRGIR